MSLNCPKSLSASSRILQTITQQETVTRLLKLYYSSYRDPSIRITISAHVFTTNHITRLPTATPSIDQSNRSPGFLNFQLTKTIT